MICPYCDGDGVRILEAGFYRSPCHYCNGQGEVWNDEDEHYTALCECQAEIEVLRKRLNFTHDTNEDGTPTGMGEDEIDRLTAELSAANTRTSELEEALTLLHDEKVELQVNELKNDTNLARLKEENTSLSDSLKTWIGHATRFKNNAIVLREEVTAAMQTLVDLKMIKDPPWRPIDLAPRDGTVILGYDGFRYFIMAFFEDKSGDFWAYGAGGEITCYPKFWLPLPNPPGETARSADGELARLRLEPKPKCYCCKKVIEYGFCDDCMTSADDLTDAGIKDLETEISRLRQERDDLRERGEALAVFVRRIKTLMSDCSSGTTPDYEYWWKQCDATLEHWRKPAKPGTEQPHDPDVQEDLGRVVKP